MATKDCHGFSNRIKVQDLPPRQAQEFCAEVMCPEEQVRARGRVQSVGGRRALHSRERRLDVTGLDVRSVGGVGRVQLDSDACAQ